MELANAVVYDIETYPNVITVAIRMLYNNSVGVWELSEYRDDRYWLLETLYRFREQSIPMIGFNSLGFDYPILHLLMNRPDIRYQELYAKAQAIITSYDPFGHMVWDRDRFCPQIDLFKIHHFDNKAKRTSLKALQINMRSPFVVNSPVPFGTACTREQIDQGLIPYNLNDIDETARFAMYSLPAIQFRIGLIGKLGRHPLEVLNYNDTKIGEKMLEERIGRDICYTPEGQRRQTPRSRIELAEIIFPYIRFQHPNFQRVLEFMKAQVLTPEEIEKGITESETLYTTDWNGDPASFQEVRTKGVFKDLTANVGGLQFVFGTGGVHASVERRRFVATEEFIIVDIDVEGLYPNIAIVNKLAPEHLGQAFSNVYAQIPAERKLHAKGTYQNAALKLAANGAWGKSNSKWAVFYDPKYAMTIPINGQLMICMLAEWLLQVPTLKLIQCNTDGITYEIHKDHQPHAAWVCQQWEAYTCLKLESANYSRMWIRDVNNYIAEDTKGKLKQKGAYWYPDAKNYADSISNASPPCWYKDLGNIVSIRAAVAHMVHGSPIDTWIRSHTDPFDFMLRAKASSGAYLMIGNGIVQSTIRYYVARQGAPLSKVSPPPSGHTIGQWKRAQKITLAEYNRVMTETGGQWDERVCTKNKSKYDNVRTGIDTGWNVVECNDARAFNFNNVCFDYYVSEAQKLIV